MKKNLNPHAEREFDITTINSDQIGKVKDKDKMALFLDMSAKISLIQRFYRKYKERNNLYDENRLMVVENVKVVYNSNDSKKSDSVNKNIELKNLETNNKIVKRESIISCKSNNYYSNSLYNLDLELVDESIYLFY
jgi:hypothetical protein